VKVELAFGETGLVIDVPADRTTVVTPRQLDAVPDERQAVRAALRRPTAGPPLRDRVRPGQTVAISMCDGTRPQPRRAMIPALLDELDGMVRPEDIVVLVATGTHRGNTPAELETMLGADVLDRVRVVNHDARDPAALRWVGRLARDVPVWLHRAWVEADVRITTGFVEPHFFAGFSGGPKLVAPGLAGLDTVLALHDARRIGDPRATWGVTVGNPVHDAIREIAEATGVDFAVDVLLDRRHRIVDVFAGDLPAEHAAACRAARSLAMVRVPAEFDVVVTTNAGFPLDQNLYQCVKGISAGAAVVREGGSLVCAAECRDGFPDHGSYREVLAPNPHRRRCCAPSRLGESPCPTSGRRRSNAAHRPAPGSCSTPAASPPPRWQGPTSDPRPISPPPSATSSLASAPARPCASCRRVRRPSPTWRRHEARAHRSRR
jgi:lactate racemase